MIEYPAKLAQAMDAAGNETPLRTGGPPYVSRALLGATASVTSPWYCTVGMASASIVVSSAQASATGGVMLEYSDDDTAAKTPVPGGTPIPYTPETAGELERFAFGPQGKWVRIRYINGATPQTAFRLYFALSTDNAQPTCRTPKSAITRTSLSMQVMGTLQALDKSTPAAIGHIRRTGEALDVHLTNSPDLSALATQATLADVLAKLNALTLSERAGQVQLPDGTWANWKNSAPATGEMSVNIAVVGVGSTARILVPAVSGKRILVGAYEASALVGLGYSLWSGTVTSNAAVGTQLTTRRNLAANSSVAGPLAPGGYCVTAVGESLVLSLSTMAALGLGPTLLGSFGVRYAEIP